MRRLLVKFSLGTMLCTIFFVATASSQSGRVQGKPTPTPPDETIKVVTEEIKLNVLAFDENGQFFSGVTRDDLVISENDILHQPASVRRLPAHVLIVMDTGGELRSVKTLDRTRNVAKALATALRPDDSVAVMQYSDRAEIVSEWTTDRAATLKAIGGKTKFGRRSAFVDALKLSINFFDRSGVDGRHLVLITDGTDSFGRSSEKFDALQALLATDITVHVMSFASMEALAIEPRSKGINQSPPPKAMPDEIAAQLPNGVRDVATAPRSNSISLDRRHIRTLKARKLDLEVSEEQLAKIAEGTNGEFIVPHTTDEMVAKAALVARMIDSSYVVTYTPKVPVLETGGITERRIDVTSKREGLVVMSRRRLVFNTSK